MDNFSRMFADYTYNTNHVDRHVSHEVKRRILDSVGVMYAAFHEPPPKMARRYSYMFPLKDGAHIFGTNFKTTPEAAAFVNGLLVRYLDFNDTYLSLEPLHPSDMIPGLWALAEWKHISGEKLILSIAIAYEIGVSLCDAASLRAHGWDHVNYIAIGEACGVSKLLDLSPETTQHAISISIIPHASMRQTRSGELSAWKGAAAANSVRNAIFSTLLASQGITGPYKPFSGDMGFFKQLLDGKPFDENALRSIKNGANPRRIMDTHIKRYPVEYHAQSAVDIAKKLHTYVKSPDEVGDVIIETFQAAYEIIVKDPEKWNPKTKETADHSLQYITVAGIVDGNISKESFKPENIQRREILEILNSKVRVEVKNELSNLYPEGIPTRVTISTRKGETRSEYVLYPKGHAKNRMDDQELIKKFMDNTDGIITYSEADRIVNAVMELDKCKDISKLSNMFVV